MATQTTRHWICPAALWHTCLLSSLVAMETSFRCFGLGFLLACSIDALVAFSLFVYVCLYTNVQVFLMVCVNWMYKDSLSLSSSSTNPPSSPHFLLLLLPLHPSFAVHPLPPSLSDAAADSLHFSLSPSLFLLLSIRLWDSQTCPASFIDFWLTCQVSFSTFKREDWFNEEEERDKIEKRRQTEEVWPNCQCLSACLFIHDCLMTYNVEKKNVWKLNLLKQHCLVFIFWLVSLFLNSSFLIHLVHDRLACFGVWN